MISLINHHLWLLNHQILQKMHHHATMVCDLWHDLLQHGMASLAAIQKVSAGPRIGQHRAADRRNPTPPWMLKI